MPEQVLSAFRKGLKLGTGKTFTLVTLLLIFIFGAFFYVYVSQNYTYLVERNFRLLATWSKELRETYENNLQTINFRLAEIQTKNGDGINSRSVSKSSNTEGPILQDFEDISSQLLYFEAVESKEKMKTSPLLLSPIQEKLEKLPYVRIDQTSKDTTDQALSSPLSFGLNLQTDPQSTPEAPAIEKESDTNLTASFDLDQLIQTVVTEPVFSDVLLVDPTGLIVYQRNPSSFRFFHLRNLLHNQRVEDGWWAEILKNTGLDSATTLDDTNLNEAIQSIVPAHVQVRLGGADYEIFMQAVVFPSSNDLKPGSVSSPTPWILCGLLPTSTFRDQYLAIPFTVLLLFIFLLVSAFLILPLLSLVLMSPRERLSRFSVSTLLITNILGAGVGTFFVLDLAFYQQTTSFFNERLQSIAQSTHEAFQLQLDRLIWQLKTFDEKIEKLQDLQRLSNSNNAQAWLARVALPDPCADHQEETSQGCFPDYSLAFWVDGKGMLRETWSPGNQPYVQGVHDLSQRKYVSAIQDKRLPLYRRRIDNQWIEFYVQPLISLENSERSFVVSMPHGVTRDHTHREHQWIAAIQTEELGLLKSAVAAPGSGMAVIDNQTGQVLFHSDPHRMLRENFLEETDNNVELSALIHARAEGRFEGKYWGTGHYFYAKPVEELPWTLVVFRSKEMFRTINFEILMFSSCLFTLYIIGLLLWLKVLSAWYRFDGYGQPVRWLWPHQSGRQAYNRLALFHIVLSILGILCMVWMDWKWGTAHRYAILGIFLPVLGLWLTVRTLWKSAGKGLMQAEQNPGDLRVLMDSPRLLSAYARLGIGSFILLGVLPAVVFFKLAHDEEMRLFVQQQMWGLAASLERHTHAIWQQIGTGKTRQNFQYFTNNRPCLIPGCQVEIQATHTKTIPCVSSGVSGSSPDIQYILQGLYLNLSFPVCLSLESGQEVSDSPVGPSWLHRLHQLVRKSSLQNPMNQESWGFIYPKDNTSPTQWSLRIERNYQSIDLLLPQFSQIISPDPRERLLKFQSAAPLFPWNLGRVMIGTILLGVFLLMASYALLRYAMARIFPMPSFIHRSHPVLSQEPKSDKESLQNLLILGPQGIGKSAFTQKLHLEWERVDLHSIGGKESWGEASLAQVSGNAGAVVVDHFEYQWGNPVQGLEKRIFIEGLLSRNIKICIMSAWNPFDWVERPSKDSPPALLSPQGPWTDLFHTFGVAYFIPNKMEGVIREWLRPQIVDGPIEDRGQLLFVNRLLNQESAATFHLKKIGKWIRSLKEWPMWSPQEMKEQFRLAAFPYYQSLWESCSVPEKLALYHVASDGYLHSHNPELVGLCQKGLLRLDPDIQLLNESFRSFVLEIATNTGIAAWEAGDSPDTWARLKYPFLLLFGVIVIFLFATQQEFKNSFITLVSLLPVLLPALPELSSLFTAQKPGSSSPT